MEEEKTRLIKINSLQMVVPERPRRDERIMNLFHCFAALNDVEEEDDGDDVGDTLIIVLEQKNDYKYTSCSNSR